MSNRNKTIARIPTTEENGFIDVYVSYNKGGINYATYKQEPRGYTLHVQPIKVENKNGFTCTSFMGFSGVRQHLETANRFSQKRLAEVAEAYKDSDTVKNAVSLVCAKQGIILADQELTA